MKKFLKVIICFVMALTLVGTSACGLFGGGGNGGNENGKTYTVTLNLNGGELLAWEEIDSYKAGTVVELPTPTKTDSTFAGWYESPDFSGSRITKIYAGDTGNKEYWAKWNTSGGNTTDPTDPSNPTNPTTYTVTLNLNGGTLEQNLTSYTKGVGATLPTPAKSGSAFGGWYDNESLNGSPVTQISTSDTGNKTYWAKWTAVATGSLTLTAVEGYNEGAFVEFDKQSGVNSYTVSYAKSNSNTYTTIDSQLIRESGNKVRADIVGLAAGNYSIQVVAGSKSATASVTVTAYDRSGYAHFGKTDGVGAYKDDGTPKDGANIVYVTEATKNSVKATIDGKSYTGIVSILQHAGTKTPLIVRIIGTVGSATWNEKTYAGYSKAKPLTAAEFVKKTPGNGTLTLTSNSKKDYTQDELIKGGFNTLNTKPAKYNGATCDPIEGLTSKIMCRSDSKLGWVYDSMWNDCSVSNVKNVTIEGIGSDALIFQWGFTFKNSSSIEVRNLHFDDYTEDGCSFEGDESSAESLSEFKSGNIWLHHNTFDEGKNYWDVCDEQDKGDGDGSTDFKGLKNITIAYNHYIETHKTNLIGGSDSVATANVTFHHNYYEGCNQRMPLGRQANMHMYNNYYAASTLYSISLRAGAYAFIENCYFTEDASNHYPVELVKGSYGAPSAKIINCVIDSKKVSDHNGVGTKYLYIGTDRAATVDTTDQRFAKNFDTNSSLFYYDSSAKKSKVTVMHTAEETKTLVPQLAGVLKK